MTVKVTSTLAAGLVDAFTGKPLSVVMTVAPGSPPLYSCPDAFSVHAPRETLAELQDDVSMKNGIRGLRDAVHPTDPYTGAEYRLVVRPDGKFAYAGGLNPRRAFLSLEELRYHLSMRGGKSPFPKPEPPPRVTRPERKERELSEENAPSDATLEAAEAAVVKAGMKRATLVSMAGPAKKGKRK